MPLDPQISLAGRGVDIKPLDPAATLLQISQIKNLQSQEQLRQLQTAQLGMTLGEFRGMQAPGGPLERLRALESGQPPGAPAPGMVAGPQLGTLPPGGGAITQSPLTPPGAPQPVAGGIAPLYDQLSPTTQAAYPDGPPADAGQPQAPPQGPPQAASQAPPQDQLEAARRPPPEIGDGSRSEQQAAIIKDMIFSYPHSAKYVVTPFIELNKQLLDQRKGELDFQKTSMELLSQGIASVMDQPKEIQPQAYAQWRKLAITRNLPGAAQQFPEQFDPQLMQALATSAQTKQERAQHDLDRLGKEIDFYGKLTAQRAEERQARTGTVQSSASGAYFQQNAPRPGTSGTMPLTSPTGQPLLPPEYGKNKEVYDAQGNLHLIPESTPPGQQPVAQRPRMATPPVPGYSAQPGAQPGVPAGGTPQLMNQEAVQKNLDVGRKVQEDQLKAAIPGAETARNSLNTLKQMKDLMHQGYYDDLFAKDLTGADAQKLLIANGRDPQKLANTFQIQNLAQQLVTDSEGNPGLRGRQTEISKLKGTTGRLDTIPPKAAALQTVEQFRQLFAKDISRYNELIQSPNTPQLHPMTIPQTVSKAEFDKRYAALKAVNPQLTKDALALRYERAGAHVEGAY